MTQYAITIEPVLVVIAYIYFTLFLLLKIVIKTNADSIEEAIKHFSKMKQLPKKEFLKLFLVTEIK